VTVNIYQQVSERNFSGHVCRMNNKRLKKTAVFGVMEHPNKAGKPKTEWLANVIEMFNGDIDSTFRGARDREMWAAIVGTAMDTKGF